MMASSWLDLAGGPNNNSKSLQQDSTKDDIELERLLNREATAFNRELEVDRILKSFKLKYVYTYLIQINDCTKCLVHTRCWT